MGQGKLFRRMVEIGRVCLVNYGPDRGKLCVILDVIDGNRVLVDGPSDVTGVARQAIKVQYLALTRFIVPVPRAARLKTLKKAFEKENIIKKWQASAWARKLATRKQKTEMNDFDRFKAMLKKKKQSHLVKNELRKLKKAYNKDLTTNKKTRRVIPWYIR